MSLSDHLAVAIALARGDEARTSPNPTVGCVVVARDGRVVGTGRTEPPGGRHAEVVALDAARGRARGATAVVTLEPCDHTGRTGPCSVALRDAGVARVVVGHRDPVPGHRGGVETMRAAGVDVVVVGETTTGGPGAATPSVVGEVGPGPAWEEWATATTPRFLRRAATGRPWVTLKVAHTLSGRTVPEHGRWITGAVARRRVHAQRATHDAVLVGVGTVLADDPRLDVRHVPARGPQPCPVVLDAVARTPPAAQVVERGAVVVVGPDAPPDRVDGLRANGATVVEVPAVTPRGVELRPAFAALADAGFHDLYAEPGDTLATALVGEGLVDELVCHRPTGRVTAEPAVLAAGSWVRVAGVLLDDDREDVWRPVAPPDG